MDKFFHLYFPITAIIIYLGTKAGIEVTLVDLYLLIAIGFTMINFWLGNRGKE